ncbi:MAG: hypothetical protein ABI267_05380 [Ginsengibacter sp.]
MQVRIIKLIISFFILFPLSGFSQETESDHPKMDKYYPRPAEEKPIANPVTTAQPVMTNTPLVNNNNTVQPNTVQVPKPAERPAQPPMPIGSAVTSTPVTAETPKLGVNNTTTIDQPAAVTQTTPVQKAVPQPPPAVIYNDNRLGSSSPQYDTWKKNNDGAGSVTTQTK